MRTLFFLSSALSFLFLNQALAQDSSASSQPSATSTFVSLTPAMSSSSVASYFSAIATSAPQQPGSGPSAGDVGSSSGSNGADSEAGASGGSSGSIEISRGGIIAIIVCVSVVVIFGIASSVLYYLAKKRSWEIRATIRKSARRVATALTPRRSTFPKDVQNNRRSFKTGMSRIDEVPPTPRRADLEKGNQKVSSFELGQPPKQSKWAQKVGK